MISHVCHGGLVFRSVFRSLVRISGSNSEDSNKDEQLYKCKLELKQVNVCHIESFKLMMNSFGVYLVHVGIGWVLAKAVVELMSLTVQSSFDIPEVIGECNFTAGVLSNCGYDFSESEYERKGITIGRMKNTIV